MFLYGQTFYGDPTSDIDGEIVCLFESPERLIVTFDVETYEVLMEIENYAVDIRIE